jgi:hypothetical protein
MEGRRGSILPVVSLIYLYLQPLTKLLLYNDQQKKYPGKSHADALYAGSAGIGNTTG